MRTSKPRMTCSVPLCSIVASLMVLTNGCSDAADDTSDPSEDSGSAGADAVDSAAESDAQDGTADADLSGNPYCDTEGLPTIPFQEGTGSAFGDIAGEFSAQVLGGSFSLTDDWTGCESYLFINYYPIDYVREVWATAPDQFLSRSARNAHYVFTSYETEPEAAFSRVQNMRIAIEDAFVRLGFSDEQAAYWRGRIHYVTEPLPEIEGSVGDLVRASSVVLPVFAIDRGQRFEPAGSVMNIGRQGFYPDLTMAAFFPRFYNYIAQLEHTLAQQDDVTVVTLMDNETVTERILDRAGELPPADEMAEFDTLEVDFTLTCHLDAEGCSEWDRIAWVWWCADDECSEREELVRWITPYSRPGMRRWVMDASPMLGLLRDGGQHTFRIETGPGWEEATERDVSVSLRLRNQGRSVRAVAAERAFSGGNFNAEYNTREPFAFTPPAGTERVEVVTTISGHGQTDNDNCAEWCNHEHLFQVTGGAAHRVSYLDQAGRTLGCGDLVDEGVVPGQWGNWSPLRAGWCPGLPVTPVAFDVTDDVTIGSENTLEYSASFEGGEPRGGNISMNTYVVYYE